MSSKKWPRFGRIIYHEIDKVLGYSAHWNNAEMMLEAFYRLNIRKESIIQFFVDGELLSDEAVGILFELYEKNRREIEEKYETRDQTNKKTKNRNASSKSQRK